MTIGSRIKQRRLELGLTQTELAQRLGLKSKVSISTVENDKEDLTTDRISKFADALETTPGYLMGWDSGVEIETRDGKKKTAYIKEQGRKPEIDPALVDIYEKVMLTEKYNDLIRRPEIAHFLNIAKDCDAEAIRVATSVLLLKKEGRL